MVQQAMASNGVARETLWVYWIATGEATEKNFYVTLRDIVATEIIRKLPKGKQIWVGHEMLMRISPYTIRARLTNVVPPLATTIDDMTICSAEYRERPTDEGQDTSQFISEIIRYPNKHLGITYDTLIGIDDIKQNILRKLELLLNPEIMEQWLERNYPKAPEGLKRIVTERYPLIILQGDVGSGKTALARSIGHPLSLKHLNSSLILYVVNAQIRGGGHVGELTQNISRTFDEAERCFEQEQLPILIFIDEADALASSRGGNQTHHEDDAGVNTLIQRIDRLRGRKIVVIFATNLLKSLDSAIMRRASASYRFDRPTYQQRFKLFMNILTRLKINEVAIANLTRDTDPRLLSGRGEQLHRYTYSDLTQRLIPYALELAMEEEVLLHPDHLEIASKKIEPTPEMLEGTFDLPNYRYPPDKIVG